MSASQRCTSTRSIRNFDAAKPTIAVIDWADPSANRWDVTEELEVLSAHGTHHRTPDLVCFVNGLPLVVIEAKRPESTHAGKSMVAEGISQHLRNQRPDEIPQLFGYAQPLFTDFSLARLADALTISAHAAPPEGDVEFLAPEVFRGGLAAADSRSDIFALCKTLATVFPGDEAKAREAREFLQGGCAQNPEDRDSLSDLAAVLERNTGPSLNKPVTLPRAEFWDEETLVPFQNARYKIVGRLGRGGIGQTFKVVEVDAHSDELYGTYVAKLIHHEEDAVAALRAYRKARAYTTHRNLSAIHEIAPEWQQDRFVALLKWIEGTPLADLAGVLALHAEDLAETSLQSMVLRWLSDLCGALWEFHRVGLVHGDVSPRNLIVHAGNIVLTDYDTVVDIGSVPRSRNLLYSSQEVTGGAAIRPADDIFSLAATFFHVLFDREPFAFGAERVKTVGCNWDQLNAAGLERVSVDVSTWSPSQHHACHHLR